MAIRVLVNGAKGRMGLASVQALAADTDIELVGELSRHDDLAFAIQASHPDVVLDFTNAEAALLNTQIIIAAGVRPVIGTTGLSLAQIQAFQQHCEKVQLGGLIVPNFSLGAVLLMKHAQELAPFFPNVEIIEMHHDKKLDSPSGTALRTAEMISETRQPLAIKPSKEIVPGSRGANHHEIPIHAVRLPGVVADLQVIFGGIGETLTLQHRTIDRSSFMPGVVLACKKVMALNTLVYGLQHIL